MVNKIKLLLLGLLTLSACQTQAPVHGTSAVTPSPQSEAQLLRLDYTSRIDQQARQYFVYLPKGYQQQGRQKWPVLLFLHGNGERGNGLDELDYTLIHGPLYEAWVRNVICHLLSWCHNCICLRWQNLPILPNRSRADIPHRQAQGVPPRPAMFSSSAAISPASQVDSMAQIPTLIARWLGTSRTRSIGDAHYGQTAI